MYSTTTISKNSKFSGRIVGTHQRLDQAARKALAHYLPRGKYFPASKEIVHFEGIRGPDGLKRKSPGVDEPSHMLIPDDPAESSASAKAEPSAHSSADVDPDITDTDLDNAGPANASGHEHLDQRSVLTMILDHHWNLVRALKQHNDVRAAFEAAWMAHMLTDGLTPAHHFPLSKIQDELMTDKEMMRVFGQPIKGVMHGRSMLETLRNNWLYWGAGGHMSQHIAYEYGVAMITATLPPKAFLPDIKPTDLEDLSIEHIFDKSLKLVKNLNMYEHFCQDGWTTELALQTKEILLPEIVKVITLGWYSAAAEAYNIRPKPPIKPQNSRHNQKPPKPRKNGVSPMKSSDLRVISGLYRGQKLRSPESTLTHPMGAREKLALFNLLQPYLGATATNTINSVTDANTASSVNAMDTANSTTPEAPKLLDLYAGSGALGIEALSRGAGEITFVEKSPKIAHLIAENLSTLNPAPAKAAWKIFSESATSFCQRPEYLSYFDIIIADPPYDNFHPEDLASISQTLSQNGVFVLSSPAKTDPPELPGLQPETTRTYAAARLTVYRHQ